MESPIRGQEPNEARITHAVVKEVEEEEEEESPQHISQDFSRERWNSLATNIFRFLETLLAFVVLGTHDASVGVREHT